MITCWESDLMRLEGNTLVMLLRRSIDRTEKKYIVILKWLNLSLMW